MMATILHRRKIARQDQDVDYSIIDYSITRFYLHPFFPGNPEIPSGKEASDSVSGQMVDPALLPQLRHDRVDPRESSLSLFEKHG